MNMAATGVRRAPRREVDDALLKEIVGKIVAAFDPRRVVLFGSRATGNWRPDSDVDLFVEMETHLPAVERRIAIRELLWPPKCAMDLLVFTPEEVQERKDVIGSIVRTILRTGRTLYERSAK